PARRRPPRANRAGPPLHGPLVSEPSVLDSDLSPIDPGCLQGRAGILGIVQGVVHRGEVVTAQRAGTSRLTLGDRRKVRTPFRFAGHALLLPERLTGQTTAGPACPGGALSPLKTTGGTVRI